MAADVRNNPAGRLLAILELLCAMPETNQTYQCIRTALHANETIQLIRRLGEVANLVSSAEGQIRSLSGVDHDLYLNWKPAVESALGSIGLANQSLGSFVRPLKENASRALERLRYCAELLAQRRAEGQLERAELDELQKTTYSLHKEIGDSQIDVELKLFILYQLGTIRDAIDQYQVFGIGPLERATHQAIGSLLLNPEVRNRTSDTPVVGKYRDLLVRIVEKIPIAVSASLIAEALNRLLLSPPR